MVSCTELQNHHSKNTHTYPLMMALVLENRSRKEKSKHKYLTNFSLI